MKRRLPLTRIAFAALLVLFLGSPVLFSVDPWDAFPDSGDTAIIILWAAALYLGAALLLAGQCAGLFRRILNCAVQTPRVLAFTSGHEISLPRSPFRSLTPLRI
jgi:hypothetical protein